MSDGERETVRVPKYLDVDGVAEWTDVDAEWYEHTKAAEAAVDRARERFGDHPRILGIGLARSDRDPPFGALSQMALMFSVDGTREDPMPEIPSRFDGIDVRVRLEDPNDAAPL